MAIVVTVATGKPCDPSKFNPYAKQAKRMMTKEETAAHLRMWFAAMKGKTK